MPGVAAELSAAGEEPNQREMKLRFCEPEAADPAADWRCSGDWADKVDSVGDAAMLTTAVEGGGGADADTQGDCWSTWGG